MSESLEGKRYVIAGGNGFLGRSLVDHLLERGASAVVLTRSDSVSRANVRHVSWDGRSIGEWVSTLENADGLVNLAGRSVDCIKTPDHQDEILRSRVESTRALGAAMRLLKSPPPVWVQMSTAHIYGDPPQLVCDEDSPEGYGLAPFVGRAWENALRNSALPNQRTVLLRTSFVIGRDRGSGGGAMSKLSWLARLGLGGRVGSGLQGMSWIHELDMNRLFARALTDGTWSGVYVASSPNPASQVEFMRTLRRAVGMPIGLPAFSWMVRIGAPLLLRTDPELALYGRYVRSRRLAEAGFEFQFPRLSDAIAHALAR